MSSQPAFDSRSFVDSLPGRPGVYRMLDAEGEVLYVGKAKSLKSRVSSYFLPSNVQPKVVALIDKSFPYVHLETAHEFPRLNFYRGSRKEPGRYFGPYPSAGAVRDTLQQLQKLFRIRNCEDSYFANRSRPCLQYQIQRCTAPCVGLVNKEAYAEDVKAAVKVLEGRSDEVQEDLARRMESAAKLQVIKSQQVVSAGSDQDADVIAVATAHGDYCVSLMFVRGGRSLGSTNFFPKAPLSELPEVLSAFVVQYYLERDAPDEILTEQPFEEMELLEATLTQRTGRRIRITASVRGIRARWLEMVRNNAEQALNMRRLARSDIELSLEDVREAFDLEETPQRLECFDISHTGGTDTVASCVVFGLEGALKSDYRRFNISGIQPGDDYAAMHQALTRRYKRVRDGEIVKPDILLIDGGKGQLAQAESALKELGVEGVILIGVAKGVERRAGQEQLFLLGQDAPTILPPDSRALHLIQRVRDEAHRFAVAGHRRKRAKRHSQSILETIPGLGPVKRRELLKKFGGLQGIMRAGIEDFVQVRGLGRDLAQVIYEHLHPGR
jgi:excinuclease ABC subunit C